jgi:predicted nucleic acid-binding protein
MVAPSKPASAKPRVFVDATVLFAGIGWPRWSYAVLRHAVQRDFQLVLSPLVIEQARRNLQEKLPASVASFDTWLSHVSCELAPDPRPEAVATHLDLVRDVEDVPVAVAALAAHVDYLVSEDKDFTEESATRELRKHVTIMRPVIFLREVMGWSSEELEEIRRRDGPIE